MKFSVEVVTECRAYSRAGQESPAPRHLQWAIDVSIHQKLNHVTVDSPPDDATSPLPAGRWSQPSATPTTQDSQLQPIRAKKVGVVEGRQRAEEPSRETESRAKFNEPPRSPFDVRPQAGPRVEEQAAKRGGQENRTESEEGGRQRKMSKLEREDELVRRAMRKTSRKVSREGQWLVIREKCGVLTTQNGTQQIKERRVRITEEELVKLEELGY